MFIINGVSFFVHENSQNMNYFVSEVFKLRNGVKSKIVYLFSLQNSMSNMLPSLKQAQNPTPPPSKPLIPFKLMFIYLFVLVQRF